MSENRRKEMEGLIPKIDNIRTLAGLLSTQDLAKEHPEYALMFLQQVANIFLAECEEEMKLRDEDSLGRYVLRQIAKRMKGE